MSAEARAGIDRPDVPPLAAVAQLRLPPSQEIVLAALWDCEPRTLADLQASHARFTGLKPKSVEAYVRRLGEALMASDLGMQITLGSSAVHGRWVQLIRQ
jgi:hypothetical protein